MFRFSISYIVLFAATFQESSLGFHIPQQTTEKLSLSAAKLNEDNQREHSREGISFRNADDAITRRDIFDRFGVASVAVGLSLLNKPAIAFDGSGASAGSGYSPATKAEKKKKLQERIVADVKDFNKLGQTIDKGETQGPAWINFFIPFQRREADEIGRTYAALVDMRGIPTKKANEFEGGGGLLLANTFTQPGKPPDNTPAVKSFRKLSKTFDAIEAAGKSGDAAKAKKAWLETSKALSQYLTDVELPGNLEDPIYKP